jgi:vancomycin resistance protein YoaR
MNHPSTLRRQAARGQIFTIEQVLLALLGGFVLFFVALIVTVAGFQIWHTGRIFPGVTVAGVQVGGMSTTRAAEAIAQSITYPQTGRIMLQNGEQRWLASPTQLGLVLDSDASAQQAYQVGRQGNPLSRLEEQFSAWQNGRQLSPVLVYNQQLTVNFLNSIAQQIDQPVTEPSLKVDGEKVVIEPGQVGRQVDFSTSTDAIASHMRALQDALINLAVAETPPTPIDLTTQTRVLETILSQPLTLTMPPNQPDEKGPWEFKPADLAPLLVLERVGQDADAHLEVGVQQAALADYFSKLEPRLQLEPQNARFIFNDDTRQLDILQSAVVGRHLDVAASLNSVQSKIRAGEHNVPLEFVFTPPAITDNTTAAELGISELIHEEVSFFYGSSADRVQNISTAASNFHGLLVAPGETFSMAASMEDITLDNGYAEALIIFGDQTIKGVGGGVCQVSTTLFRSAFFSGFPISERHAHAYRVSYYEKTAGNTINPDLAGLDATVFVPLVDLKFTNDSPYWLLMETYVNPTYSSLVWKFYSTSDGRTVQWETTGPINTQEPPKPLYRENAELETGEVKQVDWEAEGADITVERKVLHGDQVYFQDSFYTHYLPWQAIYEYGPGTEGMPPDQNDDNEDE